MREPERTHVAASGGRLLACTDDQGWSLARGGVLLHEFAGAQLVVIGGK